MKSMTGYGEATVQDKKVKIAAQVRSLNHRALDLQLRVPREYLALEEEVRQRIRENVARGRVELFLTRSAVHGPSRTIELDEQLVSQFLRALRGAQRKFALRGELDVSILGSRPELVRLCELEVRGRDERALVLRAIHAALRSLDQSRRREGRNLQRDIRAQMKHLRALSAHLEREAKTIAARLKESFLSNHEADAVSDRGVTGEVNFKGDIHEEVVRLQGHLTELGRVVRTQAPSGKRIEFLLQELQREFNTIGAKAPQLAVSRLVVEGKERVEKIREQAQNVE